jgi:iron complex transport system ATP-binding protein
MSGVDAAIGLYRERSPDLSPRAWQLLEWLGMTGLAERPFGILSQGERQRVVLARAWMANPQILILDEPTTGLDLVARERLLEGLTALVDEGGETSPVLVYVTHQIDEVLPWFTHGLLLRSGRIVEKGEKSAVIANGPLQQAFGLPVELVWRAGRPFVTLV